MKRRHKVNKRLVAGVIAIVLVLAFVLGMVTPYLL